MSVPAFDPGDYQRHGLGTHYASRESLSYMLQLPDDGLAGFVYTWVNGESLAGAALCLYGPAVGDQALFEAVDGVAVDREQPFSDWRVGGLELHHAERTSAHFDGDEPSIRFTFDGAHPPYSYGS